MPSSGPVGTENRKMLPWPGVLVTLNTPPKSSINRTEIVRPKPVPPYSRVVELSACENGAKTFRSCVRFMPIPVSRTMNRRCGRSPTRMF